MIKGISDSTVEERKSKADEVRRIVDLVEAGEIKEFAVVAFHFEKGILSLGFFSDRLRMLGALEMAKQGTVMGIAS